MNASQTSGKQSQDVLVAGENLEYKKVTIDRAEIRGEDIASVYGFKPDDYPVVLAVLPDGQLETLRSDEVVTVREDRNRFIVVPSDRDYRWSIDGQFEVWPCRYLSGAQIRKLGKVPPEKELYLERVDHPDRLVGDQDMVDLDPPGVERFRSRPREYKLDVQGVTLVLREPTIIVRDAMVKAGFDPAQRWQIFLIIAGHPKQKVTEDYVVDLRAPGIEKIRLSPDAVINAEGPAGLRRVLTLLPRDEAHLNRLGLPWETIVEGGRRFILIHHYKLPRGYSLSEFLLVLELPQIYPQQAIYGFFPSPALVLTSGRVIPNISQTATIDGQALVGWSRFRNQDNPWNAQLDGISSHLMLVDAALALEVGE